MEYEGRKMIFKGRDEMEFIKGDKIDYKLFKIILNVIVIVIGGCVFCDATYMQLKYIYYCNKGVKNIAQTYKKNDQIMLEYAVDGKKYLNNITDDVSPKEIEEIYYLEQQPEKFYRVAYKETIVYGYLFIGALLILRIMLIAIIKYTPSHIFYGKRFAYEKEIISFGKKRK